MNQFTPVTAGLAEPLLALDNIAKTYFTGADIRVDALRSVSLAIYPGEFVAIMGASGSGKSTLMNILGCLDRPSRGTYRFAGHDVAALDSDALAWLRREAFGFIFQSYNLLAAASAEENVEIPAVYAGLSPAVRKQRADALLTSLGLGERLSHRPSELSGGQQQRVCIARALINGGKIILADEPTGALDTKSGTEVMALLKDLADKGHTVILITHDARVAAHANRVIEIQDGRIVKDKLAATLNRMLDRTNGLTDSLKHLSNDIAHDLRTPLGRLRRQLDSVQHRVLSPEEHRAVIEQSVVEVDAILDTFSAILRIAQIESGNRRSGFQRFCLSQLVADVCETFGPALEEDGRTLCQAIEPDLWVQGDQELLTLSLSNLLENAATHTQQRSKITVSLRNLGESIEMGVADDGPGVPEGERKRIFQRFYRLESSRSAPGNGLGLSIVAAVAELHVARIDATDNGPGLRIVMTFSAAA